MGIEQFYGAIVEAINYNNSSLNKKNVLHQATHAYIDFKSMIYDAAEEIVFNKNLEILQKILNNEQLNSKSDNLKNIQDDVIRKVIEELLKMLNNENIKYFYISLDGIPELSKCVEQKHRKTMGHLKDMIKNKIKSDKKYKIDEIYLKFEEIKFYHYKIMSEYYIENENTKLPFLDKVTNELIKKFISPSTKSEYKILESNYDDKKIIIDNLYYGEGEAKFMYDIAKNNTINNDSVLFIYSPDSDVILLSCMCFYKLQMEHIYPQVYYYNEKHKNNKNTNGIIHINSFVKRIGDKITYNLINSTENKTKQLRDIKITIDLICLFTFLGNDFIPRVNTMRSSYDSIPIIFETYKLTYNNIYNNDINNLVYIDRKNNKHCIIYKIFIDFLKNFIKFEKDLYDNSITKELRRIDNKNKLQKIETQEKNYILSNEYYFNQFVNKYNQNVNESNINNNKLNKTFKDKILIINSEPNFNFNLTLPEIKKNLNEYDKEIIEFDNLKDSWGEKLNVKKLVYYDDGNDKNNHKYSDDNDIKKYLEGYVYVFDWYFDRMFNTNYADKKTKMSTWFYKDNNKFISIKRIYEYLSSKNKEIEGIKIPYVEKENYFDIKSHYEYIKSNLNPIDLDYNKIDCGFKSFFEKCFYDYKVSKWNEIFPPEIILNKKEKYFTINAFGILIPTSFVPESSDSRIINSNKEGGYKIKYLKYLDKNNKF